MPNLRRLPPAPPSPAGTVATFDPTVPGQYAWEPAGGGPSGTNFVATFTVNGNVAVQTYPARFKLPVAGWTILGVSAEVNTAPTGQPMVIDILNQGTSIYNVTPANRPTIPAGGFNAPETVPDTTAMVTASYLQVAPAQVGNAVPGADLTVFVRYSVP